MSHPVSTYFGCPDLPGLHSANELSPDAGFFRFGEDVICYGRSSAGRRARSANQPLYDVLADASVDASGITLPFDPSEVVTNLWNEKYAPGTRQADAGVRQKLIQAVYYLLRPFMPLSFRKHLQKIHLRDWQEIAFPHWPVDFTVDLLMQRLLVLAARSQGVQRVPFIWFWPEGANACCVMTHDVEEESGRAFCSSLMSINEQFGIPASFQVVPEKRYQVSAEYLNEIRVRGFEVNVQDLDHDGRLFREHNEFVRRVKKINQYGKDFHAKGFRSAILYRNQDWFHLLDFDYDLSVPNVAHLDPQRGGCCTVMPYFIGNILELPVTVTQDHTLFNVLKDYSLSLWERQTELIMQHHGLMGFIVHPDYIIAERPQAAYKRLLEYLAKLRSEKNVWIALPAEVARWWRERSQMRLVSRNGKLVVEGAGCERAQIAYACVEGGRVFYEIAGPVSNADAIPDRVGTFTS